MIIYVKVYSIQSRTHCEEVAVAVQLAVAVEVDLLAVPSLLATVAVYGLSV